VIHNFIEKESRVSKNPCKHNLPPGLPDERHRAGFGAMTTFRAYALRRERGGHDVAVCERCTVLHKRA
jgi:hypothetical protein